MATWCGGCTPSFFNPWGLRRLCGGGEGLRFDRELARGQKPRQCRFSILKNPPRKQEKSGSICGMICGPKWIPQMVQRSLNKQTSLTLDRSPLSFSSLLIPLNGSYNPCKQLDSKCKTSISEKYPFPFRGSLVHQQSLAKQPQHHPKSHLKRDPKKKQKRVIRFSICAFKLVSKLEPK